MAQSATLVRRLWQAFVWLILLLLFIGLLAGGWLWWTMQRSRPVLEGEVAAVGLLAPVSISRDADGVATLTGENRRDLAQALGFLHAQERFFQMDTLRRLAAGELSVLLGDATQKTDRQMRVHRFRARAQAIVAAMPADERALLEAYVTGVNQGRAALGGNPWEYLILRGTPDEWRAEDTILAVMAMYINLQPVVPRRELDRALADKRLGREMTDLLFPLGSELDAPLDESRLEDVPFPAAAAPAAQPVEDARRTRETPFAPSTEVVGSNNWAVGGALTAHGGALVANDMHLGLDVPSIWYRARLVVRPKGGSGQPLDATGVTLPGTPFLVAGSNGRVAWGYTNSYIDTADAVIVEWVDRNAGTYRTPDGVATVIRHDEPVCVHRNCEKLVVAETRWGPIIGEDAFGRSLAMRWTAHDTDAIRLAPALEMEGARDVPHAIEIAQRSAIPQQNLVVGDHLGNIAWTIIGRVPARFGFFGQDAVSFADGTKGWAGMLPPDQTPVVQNPDGARIWTANSRVLGGAAHEKLGDGGYDAGARAGRIRDLLREKARFTPQDFLAIQLDDVSTRNRFWQTLMLAELQQRKDDPALAAMIPHVRDWGERAVPQSVGYRLVDRFRRAIVEDLYKAWLGERDGDGRKSFASGASEGTARRLLAERPAQLVPPGHRDWDAFLDSAFAAVAADVQGPLDRHVWGEVGRAGVSHPLARAIKPLAWFANPKDVAVPGDRPTVRAAAPGFGASERFSVAPGREAEGLFHMPGGQAGNPRAPYYLAGHDDWVAGRATPFLPGPANWTMTLKP